MPFSYAYIRCSSEEQKKSGLGTAAQRQQILSLHRLYGEEPDWGDAQHDGTEPDCSHPGFFYDLGVSAYKREWSDRPAASALLKVLKSGDVIHFAKADRAFRSTYDFACVVKQLDSLNVSMRFADLNIDSKTPTGRALLSMLVVWAEWESSIKGARVREAKAAKLAAAANASPHASVPPVAKRKKVLHKSVTATPLDVPIPYSSKELDEKDYGLTAGRVHFYIRCSHEDQVVSGLGLQAQRAAAERYCQRLLEMNPLLEMGEVFTDAGVSAFTKRLRERPNGARLCESLKTGDHVIFLRMDRAFRNTIDMRVTLEWWKEMGVTMHFADQMLDLSSPMGIMFATTLAMFAELESQMNSDRTKAGIAQLKKRGLLSNMKPPVGFQVVVDSAGIKRLVLDRQRVAIMKLAHIYWKRGMTANQVTMAVEKVAAKHLGFDPVRSVNGEEWPLIGGTGYKARTMLGRGRPRTYLKVKDGKKIIVVMPFVTWRSLELIRKRMNAIDQYRYRVNQLSSRSESRSSGLLPASTVQPLSD